MLGGEGGEGWSALTSPGPLYPAQPLEHRFQQDFSVGPGTTSVPEPLVVLLGQSVKTFLWSQTDRLQIAKGKFLPFGHEKESTSLNRKQRTRFKCKTKTLSSCFTNFRAIYSWTSFQVFKINMGSDAEKRQPATMNTFVGIDLGDCFFCSAVWSWVS